MLKRSTVLLTLAALASSGCDLGKLTVNTTSKVLVRAQPAIKQESDYEMAARAIPASIKTVEGFHAVDPDNRRLKRILTEGYCQYSTGFIEDEWEQAKFANRFDESEYHATRATKAYIRCMNYALELLGEPWGAALLGDLDDLKGLTSAAGHDERDAMMFLAIGLAGSINMNKDDVLLLSQVPKAKLLLDRVIELDGKQAPEDRSLQAMPHVALGMMNVSIPAALGGQPELGKKHFDTAIRITEGKYLLAQVLMARGYGVATQNRKFFEDSLVKVLQTDPAVWPEQRLANEIAHRRARRYLKLVKEWF